MGLSPSRCQARKPVSAGSKSITTIRIASGRPAVRHATWLAGSPEFASSAGPETVLPRSAVAKVLAGGAFLPALRVCGEDRRQRRVLEAAEGQGRNRRKGTAN